MTFIKNAAVLFFVVSVVLPQSYLNHGSDFLGPFENDPFRSRAHAGRYLEHPDYNYDGSSVSINAGKLLTRRTNFVSDYFPVHGEGGLPSFNPPSPVTPIPASRQPSIGICFLTPQPFQTAFVPVNMPPIPRQDIQYGVLKSYEVMDWMRNKERHLREVNIFLNDTRSSQYMHSRFFGTTAESQQASIPALQHSLVSLQLMWRHHLNPMQASFGLQHISSSSDNIGESCPAVPICGERERFYRTNDGSCNNLLNSDWGRAMTGYKRILPPTYADGISSPRRSVTGKELPSARFVSSSVIPTIDNPSPDFTIAVMAWGQFISHDLLQTPVFMLENGDGIECCAENGKFLYPDHQHPECLPIEIPANDPFFSRFYKRCMNFVRSLPAPKPNCTLGFREQQNRVTHYLDVSQVYGISKEKEDEVRSRRGGQIKLRNNGLLPTTFEQCFLTEETGLPCLVTGDSDRANQQPMISALHTLWPREHNRIAKELYKLNPSWSDETLYQETRRIVIAQMQHIVFNEWLPIILGQRTMEECSLALLKDGFSYSYDKFLEPEVRAEFSTVAFRFGHSLISGEVRLQSKYRRVLRNEELFEHVDRPILVSQPVTFNQLVEGFLEQPMESHDNSMADDVTNRLFQTSKEPFGMDLASLNIQRGRDHGVGTYADMREVCGLGRPKSFGDLTDFIPYKIVEVFKRIYASVDDVDGFVAGISELPVNGGTVGPTFSCIIKDQFVRVKFADRFFYENGGMPTSFSPAQLQEIRKTSWARIMCDNGDTISHIQPHAFLLPGPYNERVPCDSIYRMNLAAWTAYRG